MARINWIRGELIGRLGEIVGERRHGKAYVRTYSPPANPQTPDQMAVRDLWARLGRLVKPPVRGVLEQYVYPVPANGLAPYIIHANHGMFSTHPAAWVPAALVLATGDLPAMRITVATAEYVDPSHPEEGYVVSVSWDQEGQSARARAVIVVYDSISGRAWAASEDVSEETIGIPIGTTIAPPWDLHAYVFPAVVAVGTTAGSNGPTTHRIVSTVTQAEAAETPPAEATKD